MIDKTCTLQVLGGLIKHPQFLSEVDKYRLTIDDFSTKLDKYIFIAIHGLYSKGVSSIQVIDIENYLESDAGVKKVFEQRNGLEYLQDIISLSNVDNFSYYYSKLKKINLLRDLKKQGIDISEFYIEDLMNPDSMEVNRRFEELTTADIINKLRAKLLHLEADYAKTEEVVVQTAAVGIEELLESVTTEITIGFPVQGQIYNKVINGLERETLTIRSGCSGLGKTRQAVGDACLLAYPIRFDSSQDKWIQCGSSEKVLFIMTEQSIPQIQKMILAYLTDINEDRFKTANFTTEERTVIAQAAELIKEFEKNFIMVKMPNPTIELVKTIVREHCLLYDISAVFYDYIFIGPALLNEFKGFSLRNDELLLMFATALKDLAVELKVGIVTSTQVNASADDNRNIRNEASLSGGRSTINKADNGAIMARPTKEEITALKDLTEKYGIPNMVTDIFKVRSGAWTQVRIWSIVDLGRMKKTDLFITDANLEPIQDFFNTEYIEVINWADEYQMFLNEKVKGLNKTLGL